MENAPDLEFEFFLAQKLGMTVAELTDRMSNEEFMYWDIYYGRLAQKRQIALARQKEARKG